MIEDVHWADEATIDLLRFAGRRLGRMQALVLVTYRDDELGDGDPLRLVLGDLATQRATRRMACRRCPMTPCGRWPGSADVDAAELCRVTGGNPFLVCEAIEAGWPAVPPTVRDVVGARLARSSAPVRETVQAAAVIGTSVDRECSRRFSADRPAPLDECLGTGLLMADGAALRFRHELVRMAVEEAIPPHRRARCTHGCWPRSRTPATPTRRCWPTTPKAPATCRPSCGMPRRRRAVRRRWAPTARRPRSTSGRCGYADTADLPGLAGLHEGLAAEYALLDRLEEAEQALRTALAAPAGAGR